MTLIYLKNCFWNKHRLFYWSKKKLPLIKNYYYNKLTRQYIFLTVLSIFSLHNFYLKCTHHFSSLSSYADHKILKLTKQVTNLYKRLINTRPAWPLVLSIFSTACWLIQAIMLVTSSCVRRFSSALTAHCITTCVWHTSHYM